jgi:hypothetical protein
MLNAFFRVMLALVQAVQPSYALQMKFGCDGTGRFVWIKAVFLLCLSLLSTEAQVKFIRLRNEIIATSPTPQPAYSVRGINSEPAVSGLFLVQFTGPFEPTWGERLNDLHVELLRSIPEDAFVARLDGVRLSQIKALPFVHWVGEYRLEYKIQSKLRGELSPSKLGGFSQVNVLLTPGVSAVELTLARRSFQSVERTSETRFGLVLQGRVDATNLTALAQASSVLWIEAVSNPRLLDEVSTKIAGGGTMGGSTNNHATITQQSGFNGAGVTVAVADSGLNHGTSLDMHPDLKNRVDGFFFYGTLTDGSDVHSHGTHIAGVIAGDGATGEVDELGALYGLGIAPKAHLVAQRIFDGAGNYEAPPSFAKLTQDALRAGALIACNSWGDDTQGRYDINAMEFDALVRDADPDTLGDQPYILVFSAGNAGPGRQTITTPAVAKNVIAAGASQNSRRNFTVYTDGLDAMADFSSRGPCEDGRIKPDLVAPGTWIASLHSAAAGDQNAWLPISANYQYLGGTSQSAAQVSGAAAVFVQYYRQTHTNATPSPALVKAALINSAVDMDSSSGTGSAPNNQEGWGRLDLTGLMTSRRSTDYLNQTVLLKSGQTYEKRVTVASSTQPLKITLAYTDVPGLPASIPALVNDLDLEVTAPDGRVYRGNRFQEGDSFPNSRDSDKINNVEAVHLRQPAPGEYLVRVRAANILEDARRDTVALDQDFALVVSGDLPEPNAGVLIFDRGAYSAPGLIQLKLIDGNRAGQPSASVRITSTTETNGELVTLRPVGLSNVFTGVVATATGPALTDGRLQIKHGDKIEVISAGTAPGKVRSATAVADLQPPILVGVGTTNRFSKTIIFWKTDAPANSIVRYGTDRNLALSVTNALLTETHEIGLDGLQAGKSYYFMVLAADEAGNLSTNDNRGALYSFVARSAATVLLVDAYKADNFSNPIPLSSYTDALDQTGVSYEVWSVSKSGSPTAADLRPFRVVMWRVSDSIFDDTTLTLSQQSAIRDYLNEGGAFFMSSMEILSRLGNVPFRSDVLQVQRFESNPSQMGPCDQCDQDAGVPSIRGAVSDPLTSGLAIDLDYSSYPAIKELRVGPDFGDTFTPTTNAVPILLNPNNGKAVALRYPRTGNDSAGRVVFLSFPLDAVPVSGPAPNNRANLLRNILSFLAPGVNGLGTIAIDQMTYTIPGRVVIEVADSDLTGRGDVIVQAFSDTLTNGQPVKLSEMAWPGLFRGSITLVPANNASVAGQLRVNGGDSIWVEYLDESAKGIVRAVARIDTVGPKITNVVAIPEYEEVVVKWDTSKPTDGLVQFGESTFLGRTSYRADLAAHQELRLVGLQPNRLYYFQIVSRDAAGNATVDDNRGRLYSVRTLKPLAAPWTDNLENSGTNWTISTGGTSQAAWQLGRPANGKETAARSATNAWGSNLYGIPIRSADTRLISPAIELTGGAQATLRFWHSYDFTEKSDLDVYEFGRVHISINNGASWILLTECSGTSAGWQESKINLTPYIGKVVRLSWQYGLFSLAQTFRPAWLIDEISLTVASPSQGMIQVTNNLYQAHFSLTGPVTATGQGLDSILTNAPPGQYVVTFSDVPNYQTPPPQTNILAANAILVFRGNYTFPDRNNNGISDLWELHFFGEIAAGRTKATDTDKDGLPDLSEFICGTDPTNSKSKIQITRITPLPDGTVRLSWSSVPSRGYRVLASTDAALWIPVSEWRQATTMETTEIVPGLSNGRPYFFRLEVQP